MKRLFAAIATITLMASASVSADSFYGGFSGGNSELYPNGSQSDHMTGVQPGVGDSVSSYGGTRSYSGTQSESGGLFSANASGGTNMGTRNTGFPDIYQGFGHNADISW
jgi:hypothetical protein